MKRDILGYLPAILLPAFLNFVSLIVYTNVFSPAEYGRYVLLAGTAVFTALIVSQWQVQAAQKYRPDYRRRGEIGRFNRYLLLLAAVSSAIVLVIACTGGWVVTIRYGLLSGEVYTLTAVWMWTQSLYALPLAVLQSDGKVRLYRLFQVANAVMKFGGGLIGVWAFEPRIESLLYGAVAANALLLGPLFVTSGLAQAVRPGSRDAAEWKTLTSRFVRYGVPMTGWAACTGILDICDRYLLEWLGDGNQVGIYAAHYSLAAALIGVLSAPIFSAAHPAIMNAESEEEVSSRMLAFTRLYLLTAAPAAVCLVLFRREIGSLFLGASYTEESGIVTVLAAGFLIWNISIIGHKGYEYKGKTMTMLGFVAIGAAINVGLNLLLIPRFGVMGAAYATLAGFGTYTALIYVCSACCIKWRVPLRWLAKLAIMLLLTGLPVFWWKSWLSHHFQPFGIATLGGALAVVLYALQLVLFGELKLGAMSRLFSGLRSPK